MPFLCRLFFWSFCMFFRHGGPGIHCVVSTSLPIWSVVCRPKSKLQPHVRMRIQPNWSDFSAFCSVWLRHHVCSWISLIRSRCVPVLFPKFLFPGAMSRRLVSRPIVLCIFHWTVLQVFRSSSSTSFFFCRTVKVVVSCLSSFSFGSECMLLPLPSTSSFRLLIVLSCISFTSLLPHFLFSFFCQLLRCEFLCLSCILLSSW